jgi:hypothetical protein
MRRTNPHVVHHTQVPGWGSQHSQYTVRMIGIKLHHHGTLGHRIGTEGIPPKIWNHGTCAGSQDEFTSNLKQTHMSVCEGLNVQNGTRGDIRTIGQGARTTRVDIQSTRLGVRNTKPGNPSRYIEP